MRLLPLVILLLFRFYDLGARPPHHDEGVNGWFVDGIFDRGYYIYDPQNYHGPLYFYILAVFEKVFGRSLIVLRIPTVIFGSLISFTPFLFRKWLGRYGTWIVALVFTVSPALIFYSRYAIHETLFVLASIFFFYYWLKVKEENFTPKNRWGFGLSLAAMVSLKENFVLYGASLVIAEAILSYFTKKKPFPFDKKFRVGLGISIFIALSCIVILFTGFFQDVNGIPNFFKAFVLWFDTGEKGNGHQKPFWYWIQLMAKLEWPGLFGLLLTPLVFFKFKKVKSAKFKFIVPNEIKLVAVMSFILLLLYSVVSYKTPWCLLGFYWGLVFVMGFWLGRWFESMKKGLKRGVVLLLFGSGLFVSLYQSYDVAYLHPDQEGHYYIYGQTFHDMMVPLNEILAKAQAKPDLRKTVRIQIISSFTWPMPFVLGEFKQTGYYGDTNAPPVLDGDEIIMDQSYEAKLFPRIKGDYIRTETRSRQWAGPVVFFKKVGGEL